MRPWVDQLRADGVGSVTEFDLSRLVGDRHEVRFARFSVDRVSLAYADPEAERAKDIWDLRLFGRPGRHRLDFSAIRQDWLREAAKGWAAVTIGRVGDGHLAHRVGSVGVLSAVLASGPGGGEDPALLGRVDVERFLSRVRSPNFPSGRARFGTRARAAVVEECAHVLREARELGLVPTLGATFAFGGDRARARSPRAGPCRRRRPARRQSRRAGWRARRRRARPGADPRRPRRARRRDGRARLQAPERHRAAGRRGGQPAPRVPGRRRARQGRPGLRQPQGGQDGPAPPAGRLGPRGGHPRPAGLGEVPVPLNPAERLWLLPRPHKNIDGTNHLDTGLINAWFRAWLERIPQIDAGPLDDHGEPVPFDRSAIHPHAFRHTYAQTLADQGVPAPVLRDLMDHRSLSTTLGYYRVQEARKRKAMEVLARHTVDNRGLARPVEGEPSSSAHLREHISWVAVPMGKCSEPTNVRAGGQACPIRYQCAGCPHFESDPSYLPELRAYADELRKEREAMLAAGATDWAVEHVSRQLEVIVGPRPDPRGPPRAPRRRRAGLGRGGFGHPAQGPPVRPRRLRPQEGQLMADNSAALQRARRQDSRAKRQRAAEALTVMEQEGEPITFPAWPAARACRCRSFMPTRRSVPGIATARDRQRQAGADRAWRLPARSLVTEQSLRAELANAKERARRLAEEVGCPPRTAQPPPRCCRRHRPRRGLEPAPRPARATQR